MKSRRRLSQRDVNSLTFNCATWLFPRFLPLNQYSRVKLRERRACTCVELTDGPIPLVTVPGIRDAINIITFDYTEGRRTRGARKGRRGPVSLSSFSRLPRRLARDCVLRARTRVHALPYTLEHSTFVSSTRSFDYFTASANKEYC